LLKKLLSFFTRFRSATPTTTPLAPPIETTQPHPRAPLPVKPTPIPEWRIENFSVVPVEGKTRFHDFSLPLGLMRTISELGFQYCTPIQAQVLPHTLSGKDAIGRAQTGTGKTAAFLITLITRLHAKSTPTRPGAPRALVLAPTRELVLQIAEEARILCQHTPLRCLAVYGGMDYHKQQKQLQFNPIDILIATPGRLLDFERQQEIQLGKVEILVLDEADRMLDMGFIPDVRRIVYSTPKKHLRQTLFFSATFTDEVKRLAEQWTRAAITVEVAAESVAANSVEQIVYITTREEKYALLYNLIHTLALQRVIVFTNRRDETRRLSERLSANNISCEMLSGDVPQAKRVKTLDHFKEGKFRVLVATDVAGRGLHVENISHVFNYNLPMDAEDYVHRIGRTGRAGLAGVSISFACEDDSFQLPEIEDFVGHALDYRHPEAALLQAPPPPAHKKTASSLGHSRAAREGTPPRRGGRRRKKQGAGL
jgi:ATP-dependent RNA helicase RhlB